MNAEMVVELEARRARLRHLNQGIAPAVDITNKHVLFGEPFSGEIFTKRGSNEEIRLLGELRLPVLIVLARIVAQRALRPAVDLLFGLLVARKPEVG